MKFKLKVWHQPEQYQWGFAHGISAGLIISGLALFVAGVSLVIFSVPGVLG